ncbi:MAG: FAD-binding oxidoreductase [Rhodospirillales bacterium]|nr:FAD-binding oxidoreductase [Rhodospirillales bacterium]
MHQITCQALPEADFGTIRKIEGIDEIAANYGPYLADESRLPHDGADFLFFPNDEAELAAIMREMGKRGLAVTVAGARTGLVGGCVPAGGAVVALDRFDKTLDIRYDEATKEWRVLAEAAVTLRDLNDWVNKKSFPGLTRRCGPETLETLEKFKETPCGYFYPPDPTEMSASLGGTVATNASGAASYKYKATREWIRRIRVMLASGEILDIPRGTYFATQERTFTVIDTAGHETLLKLPGYDMPETKNTAGFFAAPGMDMIDLFIGSEGLFGILTQIEVALERQHDSISVVQFLPSADAAIAFVKALREEAAVRPEFMEFYDANALALLRAKQIENPKFIDMPPIPEDAGAAIFYDIAFVGSEPEPDFRWLQEITERCGARMAHTWAGYERRDLARFRHFRHALPETVNAIIGERKKDYPGLHKLGTDLAVPDQCLEEIWSFYVDKLDEANLEWVAFGHIGDNHFHVNILPKDMDDLAKGLAIYKDFAAKAVALKGTVSAEHGIGKMKKKFLSVMYTDGQLEEMKALKLALDPAAMFNPGDILDFDTRREGAVQ